VQEGEEVEEGMSVEEWVIMLLLLLLIWDWEEEEGVVDVEEEVGMGRDKGTAHVWQHGGWTRRSMVGGTNVGDGPDIDELWWELATTIVIGVDDMDGDDVDDVDVVVEDEQGKDNWEYEVSSLISSMPSNPPIRSRYTSTFNRTSLVKGMNCRMRAKYASIEIRGTAREWKSVIGSVNGLNWLSFFWTICASSADTIRRVSLTGCCTISNCGSGGGAIWHESQYSAELFRRLVEGVDEIDEEGKEVEGVVGETVDVEDGPDDEDEYVVSAMCTGARVGGWPSRETLGGELGVEEGDREDGVLCCRNRCCWYFG
jgi:hypothetical protein